MTNHFVNLVSWRYFIKTTINNKRNIFIDSLSLWICCRLFGVSSKKTSGVWFFHNRIDIDNSIFLLSSENKSFKNKVILPFWKSVDEIILDNLLIQQIEAYESIVIGISSPKQDFLADLINNLYPEKHIYCLGAAIYTSSKKNLLSDKFEMNWLIMMLNNFNRFRDKIRITIIEFNLIIFNSTSKDNFKLFLKKIKN